MKGALSAIDLFFVVKELQELDGKIDQVYIYDNKSACLRLYIKDVGKRYLRIELPNLVYISDVAPPSPRIPPGITLFLRKLLSGARITSISQHTLERALIIDVQKAGVVRRVIVELFDKGNMLVLEHGKIRGCLEQQAWSNRVIRPGEVYQPPQRDADFMGDFDAFVASLPSEGMISKVLATKAGLGGEYALEVCSRLGMDPKLDVSVVGSEVWVAAHKVLKELLAEHQPRIYFKPGTLIGDELPLDAVHAVTPVSMQMFDKHPSVTQPTFNGAIDIVYGKVKVIEKHDITLKESKKSLSKTQRIYDSMEKQEVTLTKSIEENSKIGEFIYANYQDIGALLKSIREIEKSSDDAASQIKERFPQVKYNGQNRTISFRRSL